MKDFLEPQVIIPLAVIVGSLSAVAMTLIIVLRDKISGVHVSRAGIEIHTNDLLVWNKVVDRIDQIDSNIHQSIRKATTGLMIIDPEKYAMSAEALLVILGANQPLIYAAYENHHTRAIKADANAYLNDKSHEISLAVRMMSKQFPELTEERCDALACHWLRKILLPNLRRACCKKMNYYQSQIKKSSVSKTVKTILEECLTKNEDYVKCIDTIIADLNIADKSSIIEWAQVKEAR